MGLSHDKSQAAFERACHVLIGGVNSPVRAFQAVGGAPPVISGAQGAAITDIDGNEYIDYVGSYGPAILGHAQEQIVTAITKAARRGTSYGAPTEGETKLAELVLTAYPTAEMVRFVNSGTEACMSAVRLARGATGRNKIVKCIGCYHGHSDGLLVQAGSGALTLGIPSSAGVPASLTSETLLMPYNDIAAARALLAAHGPSIAAILIEPVCGNMGVVLPRPGYLKTLRELCDANGSLLIFDEVMTGFRLSFGGVQELYGVQADITTLGKVIGGGLPVGAYIGSTKLMSHVAPLGPIYQAGTLSGNPLAMAAGRAALEQLRNGAVYGRLEALGETLAEGLKDAVGQAGLAGKVCINRAGSMITPFFTPGPVTDYATATASNTQAFAAFFHGMLEAGIYLPPSQFESWFISTAHTDADITATSQAAVHAFRAAGKLL